MNVLYLLTMVDDPSFYHKIAICYAFPVVFSLNGAYGCNVGTADRPATYS